MSNPSARDRLKNRLMSLAEENVAGMLAWMRTRRSGRIRKRQTPLQEFRGNLASMTNDEMKEMVAATEPKRESLCRSLIRMPAMLFRTIRRKIQRN